jgi:hypothetical protein
VAQSILVDGSFVWTLFPFGPPDPRDLPGPVRHIAYVLATRSERTSTKVLLAYTSSGPWRSAAATLPRGIIEFDAAAAKALGQRPFHIDLRCLAQVPVTAAWFPDIAQPRQGVVGVAGARLQVRIQGVLDDLVERSRELIEIRGPR